MDGESRRSANGGDGETQGSPLTSRQRGDQTWRLLLERVAKAGGSVDDWGSVTFAELDYIARERILDRWDRAAFIATCAFNANPFLKRYVQIKNPFRYHEPERDYEKVDLKDVPF